MSSKCIRDTVSKVKTKYQESDPYRLAAAMHIIVKKLPLGTDPNCCKGFCMRECRKTCIVINCDLPEIIQQIILIHEIGHALLHQKTLQIKCFRLEGSNFRLGGIAPIIRAVPSFHVPMHLDVLGV